VIRKLMPIVIGVGAGLAYWGVDALIAFFRTPGATLEDLLLYDVPASQLLIRVGVLAGSIGVGIIVSRFMSGSKPSLRRSRKAAAIVDAIRDFGELYGTEASPDRLLQESCVALAEARRYQTVWAASVDDTGRFVSTGAAGLDVCLDDLTQRLRRGDLPPCVMRAQLRRELVITESGAGRCAGCPIQPHYQGRAVITARMERDGQFYGILSASAPAKRLHDSREQQFFHQIALEIANSLGSSAPADEERPAEDALSALTRAVASAPNAAVVCDLEGRLTHVNAAFLDLWGYEYEEDALASDVALLWDAEEEYRCAQTALDESGRWMGNLTARRTDGSTVELGASADLMSNSAGDPIGLIFSFHAIREAEGLSGHDPAPASDDVARPATGPAESADAHPEAAADAQPETANEQIGNAAVPDSADSESVSPFADGEQLWSALSAAAAPALALDADSMIADVTPRAEEILSATRETLVGTPVTVYMRPGVSREQQTGAPARSSSQTPVLHFVDSDGTPIEASTRFVTETVSGGTPWTICVLDAPPGDTGMSRDHTEDAERAASAAGLEQELVRERERADRALADKERAESELAEERERAARSLAEKMEVQEALAREKEQLTSAKSTEEEFTRERDRAERALAALRKIEEELARERERTERTLAEKRAAEEDSARERERSEKAFGEQRRAQEELALERKTLEEYLSQHENAAEELDRAREHSEELFEARIKAQEELDEERQRAEKALAEVEKTQREVERESERIDELLADHRVTSEELDREKERAEREIAERKRTEEELAHARDESEKLRAGRQEALGALARERERAEEYFAEQKHAQDELTRQVETAEKFRGEYEKMRTELGREKERAAERLLDQTKFHEQLAKERAETEKGLSELEKLAQDLTVEREKSARYLSEVQSSRDALGREHGTARRFLDIARGVCVELDQGRNVTYVSPSVCSLLDTAREKIIGRNWLDTFIPDSHRQSFATLISQLASGEHPDFEDVEVPVAVGDDRKAMLWNGTAVRNEAGALSSILLSGTPAEAPTAEAPRDEEFDLLGAIPQQAAEAMIVTDLDFRITLANPAAARLYGCTSLDLLGKVPQMLPEGNRGEEMRKEILETISAGRCWSATHSLARKNGEIVTCDTLISPMRAKQEELSGFIIIQRDVSVYADEEQFLRSMSAAALMMERADTGKGIFEAASLELGRSGHTCCLVLADRSRNSLSLTLAIRDRSAESGGDSLETETFEAPLDDVSELHAVLGERRTILIDDPDELVRSLSKSQPSPVAGRVEALLMNGRTLLLPLTSEDDAYGALIVQSTNLRQERVPYFTEIAEIFSAAWRRAALINKLTRDVSELEESRDALAKNQRSDAAEKLTAAVTSELDAELNAASGYADLIGSRHGSDDPTRENVAQIRQALSKASTLTADLLSLSDEQEPERGPLNVNEIVTRVEPDLRQLLGDDIEVVTELHQELGSTPADPDQMERLISTLAAGARGSMPHGGTLTIRTENVTIESDALPNIPGARSGRYVVLTLEDSGEGTNEEFVDRLLDPSTDGAGRTGHTGLQLAVVDSIAQRHDGWIRIWSQQGRGSAFMVYLPVVREPEKAKAAPTDGRAKRTPGNRVLVVEDEESVRRRAVRALTRRGYSVVEAASAEEAMEVFLEEEGDIDLVFSNLILPAKSGMQLADEIVGKWPGTKILLSTGRTDEEEHLSVIRDRGFGCLQKPYQTRQLVRSVEDTMGVQ